MWQIRRGLFKPWSTAHCKIMFILSNWLSSNYSHSQIRQLCKHTALRKTYFSSRKEAETGIHLYGPIWKVRLIAYFSILFCSKHCLQLTSCFLNATVENFKPKLLAVRTIVAGPGTGKLRLPSFWFYTLLGLTVPYRIWFSRHCDRLEVVLAKEVTV